MHGWLFRYDWSSRPRSLHFAHHARNIQHLTRTPQNSFHHSAFHLVITSVSSSAVDIVDSVFRTARGFLRSVGNAFALLRFLLGHVGAYLLQSQRFPVHRRVFGDLIATEDLREDAADAFVVGAAVEVQSLHMFGEFAQFVRFSVQQLDGRYALLPF